MRGRHIREKNERRESNGEVEMEKEYHRWQGQVYCVCNHVLSYSATSMYFLLSPLPFPPLAQLFIICFSMNAKCAAHLRAVHVASTLRSQLSWDGRRPRRFASNVSPLFASKVYSRYMPPPTLFPHFLIHHTNFNNR